MHKPKNGGGNLGYNPVTGEPILHTQVEKLRDEDREKTKSVEEVDFEKVKDFCNLFEVNMKSTDQNMWPYENVLMGYLQQTRKERDEEIVEWCKKETPDLPKHTGKWGDTEYDSASLLFGRSEILEELIKHLTTPDHGTTN